MKIAQANTTLHTISVSVSLRTNELKELQLSRVPRVSAIAFSVKTTRNVGLHKLEPH